jgi:glutamyl-tRNA synthetase
MRVEDLDRNRVRQGMAERILADLAWLGLDWDEGPYEQSARHALYRRAFEELHAAGRLYPCFCTRRDVAAAASAPQGPGEEALYPGTCRDLSASARASLQERRPTFAWRFRVDPHAPVGFDDLLRGRWGDDRPPPGDFVVWRSDGVPAYQLAVVVDDAAMEIDEVVRGDDLLPSTPRQISLFHALGRKPPRFGHVPLLLGPDGARLSKRHDSVALSELRERGIAPERIVGRLAHLLGLKPRPLPIATRDLVAGFSLGDVRPCPQGIVIDGGW